MRTAPAEVGTVLSLPGVALAELLGTAFDLVWIDLEHGSIGVGDVPALAIGLRAAGCRAEVRVPSWHSDALGPVLDAGVDGVVFPGMEREGDAADAVRLLDHPPAGTRGYGPRRAGCYGRIPVERPRCTVQIESVAGVEAAARIAGVRGVDAVVVGCADLALAMAARSATTLPDAIASVRRDVRAAGKAFGIAGARPAVLRALRAGEVDLLLHSVDCRLYAAAADRAAAEAREHVAA